MIIPDNLTIQQYINLCANGAKQHARITYVLAGIVFEDDDITSEGIMIREYVNDGDSYKIGYAYSKQVSFNLFNSSKMNNLNLRNEFKLEFGVEDSPNHIEWAVFGYFKGNETSYNVVDDVYSIIAYDRMQMFDTDVKPFLNNVDWYNPDINDFFEALCDYVNIDYYPITPYGMIRNINKDLFYEFDTCKEVLCAIAEASCCNARITPDGKLYFYSMPMAVYTYPVFPTKNDCFSISIVENKADVKKYKWQDLENEIWDTFRYTTYNELYDVNNYDGYSCLSLTYRDGTTYSTIEMNNGYPYKMIENPFLKFDPMSTGSTIFHVMYTNFIYLLRISHYADISTDNVCALCEAGDIVYIQEMDVHFPVYFMEINWNGSFSCHLSSPQKSI